MIRAVLFDLDGTLVDSAPDLVAALNEVRIEEGLAPMPYEELRSASAFGAAGLVGRGLPPGDEQVTEHRKNRFLDYYQKDIYHKSQLFDGIPELIEWLQGKPVSDLTIGPPDLDRLFRRIYLAEEGGAS